MIKSLSDVSPYQGIYDDVVMLGNGGVVFGFVIWNPELWTVPNDSYEGYSKELLALVKKVDDNTTLHWQTYVYDDRYHVDHRTAKTLIQAENFKSWDQRNVMRSYTYLFVTLSNEDIGKISGVSNALFRSLKYVINRPFKREKVDEFVKTYELTVSTIEKSLEMSKYLTYNRLDAEGLRNAIHGYYSQEYDKANVVSSENKVNPDITYDGGVFKVGNNYVGIVSLVKEGKSVYAAGPTSIPKTSYNDVDLPESVELNSSMSFPLTYGLPFPHIYNVCIEKMNNEVAIKTIKDENPGLKMLIYANMGQAISKQKDIGGKKTVSGDYAAVGAGGIIDQVEANHEQIVRTRVNIIVKDPDKGVLNSKLESVRNVLLGIQESVGLIENTEVVNLFFASAPGNMRENYKALWQLAGQGICYIPKESLYRSDPEGIYFLDRTGAPVVINTWANKHIVARNALVFAPTGSGKSVLLNHLVDQYVGSDYYVIIIDIGGSFKNNTTINKGYYFDAADSRNLSFNIFLCRKDAKGKYIYMPEDKEDDEVEGEPERKNDQINFVYSILARIWKGDDVVSKETKAALKKTIVAFYDWVNEHNKFPTLKLYDAFIAKFYDKIISPNQRQYLDVEGFRLVLEEYVSGQYKDLLNSEKELLLTEEKFMVFDLEAIKDNDDINKIVIAIIMQVASEIIYYKSGRKAYIIDEAIDYLKGDMGDFIAGQFRKIRKRNGQAIMSTQGVGYLEDLSELTKKSIFGNTAITYLLDHSTDQGSKPLLQKNLSMTSNQMKMLDSVGKGPDYRELLLKMGRDYCQVVRVQDSKFAIAAYSTDPRDVDQIKVHYEKTKDIVLAIYDYLDSKGIKNN